MSNRVFVGNLSYSASSDDLLNVLSVELGLAPLEVKVITDRETGNGKGFAFVEFENPQAAMQAIAVINGHMMFNRPLRADRATERANSNSRPSGGHRPPPPMSDRSEKNNYGESWGEGSGRRRR